MYPGGLAEVIYRPMSKVSWAYPQDAEDMYPFDGTGEKSKEMFLMSDNYKEVDGKIVNKDGSPVTFTFTLPSEAATHPAGAVFTEAQATLAKIGVEIIIDVDANVLNKLEMCIRDRGLCAAAPCRTRPARSRSRAQYFELRKAVPRAWCSVVLLSLIHI